MNKTKRASKGFGSVEIIVVASILFVMITAVAGALFTAQQLARSATDQVHANLLIEESSEALQIMRDDSWDSTYGPLTLGNTYYLVRNASSYSLSTVQPVSENYYASVVFSEVRRDANGVLDSSGNIDPNTLKAHILVSRSSDNTLVADGYALVHNSYEN